MFNKVKKDISDWIDVTARNYVRRQGFVISKPAPDSDYNPGFIHILSKYFLEMNDFFFVQIGGNDGVSFDDLYGFVTNYPSRGVILEPVEDYFEDLKHNYREYPNITPVNAGLHPSLKEATIYRVDPAFEESLAGWTKGIASLDPNHHKKSRTSSDVMIEERVRCISWDELISEYGIAKIDLLQIDTEGFDFEVLKMVDWAKFRPKIIRYEHESLSDEDRKAAWEMIQNLGYKLWRTNQDTVAVMS